MVKKTKRFRYEAKKSTKEQQHHTVQKMPASKTEPVRQTFDKKRMIAVAGGVTAVVIAVAVVLVFQMSSGLSESESDTLNVPYPTGDDLIDLSTPQVIFKLYGKTSEKIANNTYSKIILKPRDDVDTIYSYLGNTENSTIAVYPSFTRTAYAPGGLAYYYIGGCENCISSKIIYDDDGAYAEGNTAYHVLKILGYDFITDVEIDKNPEILLKYDRVILLHNEYATQNMFDAITSHPNVVYLYPGALSIKTTADYVAEQLLLVRGNGYPDVAVGNGFDWEFDNTDLAQDGACQNWEFIKIQNGHMLNCYPESTIHANPLMLLSIKELNDPYWKNPLQNISPDTLDENSLKLILLNDEILKLTNPQENLSSATTPENVSAP